MWTLDMDVLRLVDCRRAGLGRRSRARGVDVDDPCMRTPAAPRPTRTRLCVYAGSGAICTGEL